MRNLIGKCVIDTHYLCRHNSLGDLYTNINTNIMPPYSSSMLGPEEPLSEKLTANRRRDDGFQEKPTSLVEVVNHLPKDVFEKRPFRAYMAALQVRDNVVHISFSY